MPSSSMTTTQQSSFFNPILAQTYINGFKTAFNNRNHGQVIDLSTKALSHVQQYELMAFLDIRAHALGMKGYFDKAIQDAKEIIKYVPERSIGYLRLGNLLHMQGKQFEAITVYEEALVRVSKQDEGYHKLVQDKRKVEEESKRRVDMISLLPFELVDTIFDYLPETTKFIACMDVSKTWHERISQSRMLWRTVLDSSDVNENKSAALISRVVPHIAHHIKDLTIGTSDIEIIRMYLEYMGKDYFKSLKNFTWRSVIDDRMSYLSILKPFTSALWQARNTLTKLDFTYKSDYHTRIYISDILFYSKNLQTLVINVNCPLDVTIGEMKRLEESYNILVDVELTTSFTTASSLRPLLQYCPKIRRLCIDGCTSDVMSVVDELYNENLEIFSYNSDFEVISLAEKDAEFYDGPPGLREIYTPNGGYGVPADSFIRLLLKNQKSLQTVYANMSATKIQLDRGEPYPDFIPHYEQWYFERLQRLIYWPDIYNVTETMFLKSIESCIDISLAKFIAIQTPSVPMIVDTLIKLPPVEWIELSSMEHDDGDSYRRSSALVQLFESYAALPPLKQNLRNIGFHYCDFVTDDVMEALIQIETIQTVEFSGASTLPSEKSFRYFLRRTGHHLSKIFLKDIEYVNDGILDMFCEMENLEIVELNEPMEITEEGIKRIVDNAKALQYLTIENCTTLSDDTISYITKKIKNVEITCNK